MYIKIDHLFIFKNKQMCTMYIYTAYAYVFSDFKNQIILA